MTDTDKKNNLDSIRSCLIVEQIPFDYNAQELTIKIKGLDMTDILLAVHDYCGEKMTDLIKENEQICHILGEHKMTIADLEKENAELRKDKEELCHAISEGAKACLCLKEQLTKAKNIIKDYKIVVEGDHTVVCGVPEENRSIDVLELNEQAEQFLKELEQ